MNRILILFAHPAIDKSRINKQLIQSVKKLDGITVNNLYENYPDFYINVVKEQQMLQMHDLIVWQHPFYWYSSPALLKEWFDLVLQHGFAYGIKGQALKGKTALSVISTGGSREVYSSEGKNHFTMNQFLIPFKQSANLCLMNYLPPFVIHGSHTVSEDEIEIQAEKYRNAMLFLRDTAFDFAEINKSEYLNDYLENHV